ncbi:MAG TPA: hypothetical protein VJU58_14660 [Microbacterium sp.]|nr:hypothetical protein [Microbacterium sp.]
MTERDKINEAYDALPTQEDIGESTWDPTPEAAALRKLFGTSAFRLIDSTGKQLDGAIALQEKIAGAYLFAIEAHRSKPKAIGDPYRTPSPPETPEQEHARLSIELQALSMQNVAGMSPERRAAGQKRLQFVSARLAYLTRSWDREAFWAAMGDDDRLELMSKCCRGCGSLDTSCQCWNDE